MRAIVCYAHDVKKSLPLIIVFGLIALTSLHRGGISFQAHLLWTVALLPIIGLGYALKNQNFRLLPSALLTLILLLILSIVSGWQMSLMQDFGLISVSTLLCGILTLLVTVQIDTTEELIHRLLKALCLFAACLCIFGIVVYVMTPIDRLSSSFVHLPYLVTSYPNAFALFLLSLFPYALYRFIEKNTQRYLWLTIIVLMTSSILLTFSRGGMIVLGLILVIFAVRGIRKKIPLTKWVVIAAMLTMVLTVGIQIARPNTFTTNEFGKKIALQSEEGRGSVDERVDFWKGSIQMIKERPLTGFGPDTFSYVFPHYQKQPLANSSHPHNMFLKHGTEFGLLSLLLYMILIGSVFFTAYRCKEKRDILFVLSTSLIAIIAHNTIDYNLNFTSTAILFWVFMGLIFNLSLPHFHFGPGAIAPRRVAVSLTLLLAGALFLGGAHEIYQRTLIVKTRAQAGNEQHQEAEKTFSTIVPLFFEDASLLRAHNAIEMKQSDQALNLLRTVTKRNPLYAEAYNLAAEIFLEHNRTQDAEILNHRALELDRFNRLRYHAIWIEIQQKAKKPISEEMLNSYEKMLKMYLELLKKNAHNTIMTDDPSSAIKITHLLEKENASKVFKIRIKRLREKLLTVAQEEQQKFFKKFAIPINPL